MYLTTKQEHDNYVGNVEGIGPVAISILEEGGKIHTITRTKSGEEYKVIDASEVKKKLFKKQHDKKSLIKAVTPSFAEKSETIKRVKSMKITDDLKELESQHVTSSHFPFLHFLSEKLFSKRYQTTSSLEFCIAKQTKRTRTKCLET